MEAEAVLVEGVDVGGHLLADGAGHGAVRHVFRLYVQPGVGCLARTVRERVFRNQYIETKECELATLPSHNKPTRQTNTVFYSKGYS
jgi:hypothetical protein